MTTSTNSSGSTPIGTQLQSPAQSPDDPHVDPLAPPDALVPSSRIAPAWEQRLASVLWQLGGDPATIETNLAKIGDEQLTDAQLETLYDSLTRELALQHGSQAWQPGADVGQAPGQQAPGQSPPSGPKSPGDEPPPTNQTPPVPDPDDAGVDLPRWLVGAGIIGAGVAGAVALRTGSRNVHALRATAAAFDTGGMHQGGLQSIRDAQLGARFSAGVGARQYLQVAVPGINRMGTGARLTAVARGHLDHAEMLASATALRHGSGDGVFVHEPLRRGVLTELERGRSIGSVLDELDRSAAGARPVFDDAQLRRYWSQASIIERGPRAGGHDVTSGIRVQRPELAIVDHAIGETGRSARINQLVAGRGAKLGERGLADGIGMTQGVNVSTLSPALREHALAASGVDQTLVDQLGIRGAYMQRWRDRLATPLQEPPPSS